MSDENETYRQANRRFAKLRARLQDRNALLRFRRDEDGALIIFSLYIFILLLWFGGIAVDLMRFETTRAQLQATLDRATLAAADLEQTLPPADVVRDYMAKAGMLHFMQGNPIVEEGPNFRRVTAVAEAEMPLFFWDLPRVFSNPFTTGVTSLTVRGGSTAEESVSDVEVSLVLDLSGSMARNNRIQNLRPAARDFVSTVLENNDGSPQGLITVSVVPYSAVVNPGPQIIPHLNINRSHNYSTCPLFETSLFSTTALNLGTEYNHVSHFDPYWHNYSDTTPISYPWCHVGSHNAVAVHSTNETNLHSYINDLTPYGNTAIDMGVKWGVALLDPSTRPVVTALAGASGSDVPVGAAGRPQNFGTDNVAKVLVLMTDGSNTQQYDLRTNTHWEMDYKWGLSRMWFQVNSADQDLYSVSSNRVSVQISGESTANRSDDWFYWHGYSQNSRYQRYPNGFRNQSEYINATTNPANTDPARRGDLYRSSNDNRIMHARWQTLYAERRHDRVNNVYMYAPYNDRVLSGTEYSRPDHAIDLSIVNNSQADARLSEICAAARNRGVVIYTVAFEAPGRGQRALQDCASSPSHYFDVSGTDISEAFSAIATDIRALKLTE